MEIPWYKYFLSYFYLVTVKNFNSKFSPGLSLQMEAGKLLLNTSNANYSYGNLHTVFEEAFEIIEIHESPPLNVLILGLGTGSVIDILQRQYGFNPKITAIEIDPVIIDLMQYWKNLDLTNTSIICGDAFEEVQKLSEKFDLILIDIFIDLNVDPRLKDEHFIEKIKDLASNDSKILINYVANTLKQKEEFVEFQIVLMNHFKEIIGHEILGMNRVLELKMT